MEDDTVEQMPKRQKPESSERAEPKQADNDACDTGDEKTYTKKLVALQIDDMIVDDDGSDSVEDRGTFNNNLDTESIDAVATTSSDNRGIKRKEREDAVVAEEAVSCPQEIIPDLDSCINLENSLTAVDDKKVFRFFWWDAYEDASRQPGVVLLFGKTFHEKTKSHISCCVAVRNIERRIFLLPRATEENSGQPVTSEDVHNELTLSVMKNLNVRSFKSRTISKKYVFDPQIPTECDYIEVRYSAKHPPVSKTAQGRTFSRVFGTATSFLEILLLDRKIKGPCWLDVTNAASALNPVGWCKLEVNCNAVGDLSVAEGAAGAPPMVVSCINMRCAVNPKTRCHEIVMLGCITNVEYFVDKQVPTEELFQKHFCVFTHPARLSFPSKMADVESATLHKMSSERALLDCFIAQFADIDCDLVVGHDLQGYQMKVLSERLGHHKLGNFSKLGKLKLSLQLCHKLFVGRLVCDVKASAKELIRCRSYDLDGLCQAVLNFPDDVDCEPRDVLKMFQTSEGILELVASTMRDTTYILRIMYGLNVIPLALQITKIAGNVMGKTLTGGRAERIEFLLLHAFSEKGYIPPDKSYAKKTSSYVGGLVLDPKVGFYDKLILLMDFNSLYPSIIEEYNICFTTVPADLSEDNMILPDRSLPTGILPVEMGKLVETRRKVKQLMTNPELSPDQRMQYHITQTALKLTANSMYGCLGFPNSRFFAKSLAALITHTGRQILTNAKDMVQKMNHEVIYGDTDSLMINTNVTDFEQATAIADRIKAEVNKNYRLVELDMDGVFKYLLLLTKKKYAAVTVSKTASGEFKTETEYKGLDIVRRDCCKFASEAGKFVLGQILTDQNEDRVAKILQHLRQLRGELEKGSVPLSLLIITKQLGKDPNLYTFTTQPHVQVALRYNKTRGGRLRAGDAVPYVMCADGDDTGRPYHVEEFNEGLKIDVEYYMAQQVRPVISRICQPIEELEDAQIAGCLGVVYALGCNKPMIRVQDYKEVKYRYCKTFIFKCYSCQKENAVDAAVSSDFLALAKCGNPECTARPVDYLGYVMNQLVRCMNVFIEKYYRCEMHCEDPSCPGETEVLPFDPFHRGSPVCPLCKDSVLVKKYTEYDLYTQLSYFHYLFDWNKCIPKPIVDQQIEKAYQDVKEMIETRLNYCENAHVDLAKLMNFFEKDISSGQESSGVATTPILPEEENWYDEDVLF